MKAAFTYWKNGDFFLGYLDEYAEYKTQGESLEDLKDHLLDLYKDLAKSIIKKLSPQ
jgi:hypothetical protein